VLDGIDVLVVPSIWYDFPLIIPSAYATRTPVIATRLVGMSDLVHDEIDGLLFNRSDVTDLRRQILRVATDRSLLETLRQGISPVKTVEEMAEEYDVFYHMLLNKLEDTSE
jgi:glycosyltransferase involved in cell wall biosynthesis